MADESKISQAQAIFDTHVATREKLAAAAAAVLQALEQQGIKVVL